MRTTIDIDDPILRDLKELQRIEGKSLGRLASDLLAQALADRLASTHQVREPFFAWESQLMGAKVDLLDKNALLDLMDEPLRKDSN
jgi:hypothetical protein